jgi:CRP/FNR family transcriptional regulator
MDVALLSALDVVHPRAIRKRTIVLYQGEVPRSGYLVKSGTLKMYRINRFGEEQIVGFRTAGELLPETWLLGKTSSTLYYYEALEDCELLSFDKQSFAAALEHSTDLKAKLYDYLVSNHTALLVQVTALNQSRAADKLALMLYYLLFRYGHEEKPGEFHISLNLTHTIIGSLIGVTRETMSVELGKLRRKGVIDYGSKHFVIHKEELARLLGDESFADVNLVEEL